MDWLDTSPPQSLIAIRSALNERVIGQEHAADSVIEGLARFGAKLAGLERPVGAFLLLGPSGVGKTLIVETLADALHGSPNALLKIHCAEIRSDHELARMKGSPPGYVGWKECVPLFHETKLRDIRLRHELAVVLFDEVEKAHPSLWDLMLGMLDKGEVVLNDNTRTDFRKTLIFLTGNTGSREMAEQLAGGMGFQPHTRGDMAGLAGRAAERLFSPEFRNRLTATVVFRPLTAQQLQGVATAELRKLKARLAALDEPVGILFDSALPALIAEAGYEPQYGARHIKRAIERLIEAPLANLLQAGRSGKRLIEAHAVEGAVRFRLAD